MLNPNLLAKSFGNYMKGLKIDICDPIIQFYHQFDDWTSSTWHITLNTHIFRDHNFQVVRKYTILIGFSERFLILLSKKIYSLF